MNKLYLRATKRQQTAHKALEDKIKATYPTVTAVSIYSPSNIYIETAYHGADLYSSKARHNYNVTLVCNSKAMTEIPTDDQALAHVQAMRDDKDSFNEVLDSIAKWFSEVEVTA